jgi:chromate transporter
LIWAREWSRSPTSRPGVPAVGAKGTNSVSFASRAPVLAGGSTEAQLLRQHIGVGQIFAAFFLVGASSFGGGIVGYLRSSLVAKHGWVDDTTFVELLGISQTLPGLNATNMAVLVGNRLRGTLGAVAALIGVCLPGAVLMAVVGVVYQIERDRRLVEAALKGVGAAAAGLLLVTTLQLGRKSLYRIDDVIFVLITVLCVNQLHVSVPRVLIIVGTTAVVWYGWRHAAMRR